MIFFFFFKVLWKNRRGHRANQMQRFFTFSFLEPQFPRVFIQTLEVLINELLG